MWLNSFKIAIIEKNCELIDALMDEMPSFTDVKEMEEASYLLVEAVKVLKAAQEESRDSMHTIKQNIKFLKSAQADKKSQLNLTL